MARTFAGRCDGFDADIGQWEKREAFATSQMAFRQQASKCLPKRLTFVVFRQTFGAGVKLRVRTCMASQTVTPGTSGRSSPIGEVDRGIAAEIAWLLGDADSKVIRAWQPFPSFPSLPAVFSLEPS